MILLSYYIQNLMDNIHFKLAKLLFIKRYFNIFESHGRVRIQITDTAATVVYL